MYKEYAIDPSILNSSDRIRSLLSPCQWHAGKVVCEYPKKNWLNHIKKNCNHLKDMDKHRTIEYLNKYKNKTCKRTEEAAYDGNSWLNSAKKEHTRLPFTAIISNLDEQDIPVVDGTDFMDENELWQSGCGNVQRTTSEICNHIAVLLKNSQRIVLVDPYFDIHNATYKSLFLQIIATAKLEHYKRSDILLFEIHIKTISAFSKQTAVRNINQFINQNNLTDDNLTFCYWEDNHPSGEQLHDRYIITELGGVKFGHSVSTDITATNSLTHLSKQSHEELLNIYHPSNTHFKPAFKHTTT